MSLASREGILGELLQYFLLPASGSWEIHAQLIFHEPRLEPMPVNFQFLSARKDQPNDKKDPRV